MNAWAVLAARHRVVARLDAAHDQMAATVRRMSYPELAELARLEGCAQPVNYPQMFGNMRQQPDTDGDTR